MKDYRKTNHLWQAGVALLFCICITAACNDNSSKTATTDTTSTTTKMKTDTMGMAPKDSVPPLDTNRNNSTRPETIKNGGTPPPPKP